MAAPTQTPTLFRTLAGADARALCRGELTVKALYKPLGRGSYVGSGAVVSVLVLGAQTQPVIPGRVRAAEGKVNPRTALAVQAPALLAGALANSDGVGASGEIERMRTGDTFDVPGWAVGKTDVASVTVRIGAVIDLVENAWWFGEVSA